MKPLYLLLACSLIFTPALQGQSADEMYVMQLTDNWEIEGQLPAHALLISLQGVANVGAPRLYFLYPEKWDFTFSEPLLEYYRTSRHMAFTHLNNAEEALAKLAGHANGYVVWDRSVRTSLIVAFTAAGLHRAVVVSEELIPLAEKYGLKMKEDFRGKFTGQSDIQIYEWAYKEYWDQCSKEYLVYMGGEWGKIMKPGIADFGIHHKSFFTDASTNPADTLEYEFAKRIFSEMKPMTFV
ncbi:MAG: GxGYxYP domain-containing protein, partial [Bacteroidota bacterium]